MATSLGTFARHLPLAAALLPLLAATAAHWLGVDAGHLPACIPYLDGCVSISATGRHPPGSFLFKAIQMPYAIVLVVIWILALDWLHTFPHKPSTLRARLILVFGVSGAAAMLVYTSFLGTSEPFYEFMRRFGIYLYFAGTVFAQLLVSVGLRMGSLGSWMRRVAFLPFLLGILNLVLKGLLDDPDAAENRIEWIAALGMQAWYVLLYIAFRRSALQVAVTTGSTSARR